MTPPREPMTNITISAYGIPSQNVRRAIKSGKRQGNRIRRGNGSSTSTTQHPGHLDELDGDFA